MQSNANPHAKSKKKNLPKKIKPKQQVNSIVPDAAPSA
jgi:hypothetical protein